MRKTTHTAPPAAALAGWEPERHLERDWKGTTAKVPREGLPLPQPQCKRRTESKYMYGCTGDAVSPTTGRPH